MDFQCVAPFFHKRVMTRRVITFRQVHVRFSTPATPVRHAYLTLAKH